VLKTQICVIRPQCVKLCVVPRRYSPCDGPIPVQVILPVTEIFTVSLLVVNRKRFDSSAVG